MSSYLNKANKQFCLGLFSSAVSLYKCALKERPELNHVIQFNLNLAQKRINKEGMSLSLTKFNNNISNGLASFASIDCNSNLPRIYLGGTLIGYGRTELSYVSEQISECISIYEQIAQVNGLHGLRVIYGLDIIRITSNDDYSFAYTHSFNDNQIHLSSISYTNSRELRLVIEIDRHLNRKLLFRAYQYSSFVGDGLVLVGECDLHDRNLQLVDISLVNPFAPVLMTLIDSTGYLIDASLIPYPTLLPGGMHEHECSTGDVANGVDTVLFAKELLAEHISALKHGWALGEIQIDIRDAIGTETIFSADFKEWLSTSFSLGIKPWQLPTLDQMQAEYWQEVFKPLLVRSEEQFYNQTTRKSFGRKMILPPRAIPSLTALTASRASGELEHICGISNFIIVEERGYPQPYRLTWPVLAISADRALEQDGAIHIPIVLVGKKDVLEKQKSTHKLVGAILFGNKSVANESQLIMPTSTDYVAIHQQAQTAYTIDVVVTVADISVNDFSALLDSLLLQTNVSIRQIISILPYNQHQAKFKDLLTEKFANRFQLLPASKNENYKQRVQRATSVIGRDSVDSFILFINRPLVFHNPITLIKLVQSLSTPKSVTVSAPLIVNVQKKNKFETTFFFGGICPVKNSAKSLYEWRNINLAKVLPRTTLPTSSHGDAFFMIKTKDWNKFGGFSSIKAENGAEYEFSAKLSASNRIHLLVPHASVTLSDIAPSQKYSETLWVPSEGMAANSNSLLIEVLPS